LASCLLSFKYNTYLTIEHHWSKCFDQKLYWALEKLAVSPFRFDNLKFWIKLKLGTIKFLNAFPFVFEGPKGFEEGFNFKIMTKTKNLDFSQKLIKLALF